MAFVLGNQTSSTNWTAGAGNRSIALAGTPSIGNIIISTVFAVSATGTFGLTDNNPDGLGTYTKICDVLDNSGVSQATVLVRDRFIGSASATTQTTTGVVGGTAVGITALTVSGVSSAFEGSACIRQFGTGPNVAANTTPVISLSRTVLSSSALVAYVFLDSTGAGGINGPSGFNNFIGTSLASPTVSERGHSITSGGLGNVFTWTSTPTVTSCVMLLEINNTGVPSVSVSVPAFTGLFPKPVLRGVV